MNENPSQLNEMSENKLIIKDNYIDNYYIQEINELNQISEDVTNSMKFHPKVRVYIIYVFQLLSIISFFVMIFSSDLALYLSILFFACFETAIISFNYFGIDEYLFLTKTCTPLKQVLEEYIYHNNISVEYYYRDYCTRMKNRSVTLPLPCQSCLDISGLFTLNAETENNFLILYIKKHLTFQGNSELINIFFQSAIKEVKTINGDCLEFKKELKFGESDIHSIKIAINDPQYKYYVSTGVNEIPSYYYRLGILSNIIGLGGVFLYYLRKKIVSKEFTIKKVISTEDFDILRQRYSNLHPGIMINNKKDLFDARLIGKNEPQTIPEKIVITIY